MKSVVIAGYACSPFTLARKGELTRVRPDVMAATVVKGLIECIGVNPADIEDLILGCAFPEGEQGLNLARVLVLLADLPPTIAGTTVNRYCGSSMQAVHFAAGQIRLDAGEVFICAGVESMTRVPVMGFNPLPNPALAARKPETYMRHGYAQPTGHCQTLRMMVGSSSRRGRQRPCPCQKIFTAITSTSTSTTQPRPGRPSCMTS